MKSCEANQSSSQIQQPIQSSAPTPALEELKTYRQWVVYRQVEKTPECPDPKAPLQPNGRPAKNNDPATWHPYEECAAAVANGKFAGLGFVFTAERGIGGTDFDDVVKDGVVEPWVLEEIKKLNTYTEVSPSGTGIHCLGRFAIDSGKNPEHNRAEIYSSGRYFTFTGNHVSGTPTTINDCQEAATSFYQRINHIDPLNSKPSDNPFADLKAALKTRSIESLLADENFLLEVGEGWRHSFLNQVIGFLWDGKRTKDDLLSLATQIAERFCSPGDREITEKELSGIVDYCIERDPTPAVVISAAQKAKTAMLEASWFQSADTFIAETIPPKKHFITDMSGNPIFTSASINQIFAFRGYGKSLLGLGLVDIMVHGGEMLGYKSNGGLKVLFCDGELPSEDLQERLKELVGHSEGRLSLMSPHTLPQRRFPALSDPDYQERFMEQVIELNPDVIVFDTLTACFKFDTNDPDKWILVNQFLIELRSRGICVIITHHAGKNGSQRGRTDGDDDLDVVIKLELPSGHQAGMGLNFLLSYEKFRPKFHVVGFQGVYADGEWEIVLQGERESIIEALNAGQTYKWILENLGVSSTKKIIAAKKYAEPLGLLKPTAKKAKACGKDEHND
jgi:hypothetical protein